MEVADYFDADDRTLVDLALQGDNTAFEYLFSRYRNTVHRVFLKRTGGSRADADDLLQDTFIKVYVNLYRYNPLYSFGQWIYTIARNTFVDFVRKRSDDLSLSDKFITPPSSSPNPEEKIIGDQDHAALYVHLQNLPELYRDLVILRFLDGYSYEEIAAKLFLPLGTVKTRIHRAREKIFSLFPDIKP